MMKRDNAKKAERPKPAQSIPGPKPQYLKINMDWRDAVKLAVRKKKPPEGWPK